LDKNTSFSSGDMRHLCWDESYEQFRVCHFIACRSKPSAEMIMSRGQKLKSMALGCSDLVRVRDCWYQPGEGAAGYGFVTLVMLDYVGNPRTTNTVERLVSGGRGVGRSIPEMTALQWGRSVANGLRWMHRANLVHGSVRPSNVFVDENGSARLGDYPFPKSTSPQPLMKEGECLEMFFS
jgi:serine/threonine protein kinase